MTKCEECVLPSTSSPFSQNLSHEDETRFADQCGKGAEDDQIYSVCNALALAVLTQETLSATNARRLLNNCLPSTLLTLALSLSKPQTHPSLQGNLQQIIIIENHTVIRRGLHIICHILAPSSTAAQQVASTGHPIIHKITPGAAAEEGGGGEKPRLSPITIINYADWTDLLKPYPKGKVSHIITLPVHQPCGNRPMGTITALLSHNNNDDDGGGEGVKEDEAKLYNFSECMGRCLAHQTKCVWEASFSMMAKVLPPQMMTRMITAAMVSPSAAATGGEEEGGVKAGEAMMEEGEDVPLAVTPLSLLLKGKAPPTSVAAALASVNEEENGDGNPRSLSPKSITRLNSQTFISTATSSRTSSELPFPSSPMLGSRPAGSAIQMRSIADTTSGHHQDEEIEEVGGGHHQYNKKKQSELFEKKEEEDSCTYDTPLTSPSPSSSSSKSYQEEEKPSLKTMDLSFSDGKMEQEYHRHFNTKNTFQDKLLLSEYACIVVACFLFTVLNFSPVCSFNRDKGSRLEGSCHEDGGGVVAASTIVMVIMKIYQLSQATACTLALLALLHTKREWYAANRTTVVGAARIVRLALIVFVWGVLHMLLPFLASPMTAATQIVVMNNLLAPMMRCSCCIIVLGAFKHRIPFRSHIVVVVMELYISLLVTALVFTNIDTAASRCLHQDQFYTVVGHQCTGAAVSSLVVYLAERQDRRRFFTRKNKEWERYNAVVA